MAKKEMKAGEGAETRRATHLHALTPFEEMERMFGSVFPRARMSPAQWEWPSWSQVSTLMEEKAPNLDIIERDNEIVVRAEMPGVDKKDIDISVTDRMVTIKGYTKQEHKEEKGDYFRSEIFQGAFSRTATLPCEVDADKARARFSDGILELTIPKLEASKRHKVKVE